MIFKIKNGYLGSPLLKLPIIFQKQNRMETKTYVMLDSMDASAPIYQTMPGGKRSLIKKRPFYRPLLQVTFTGEDGKNRTIRYKKNSNSIFQDDQIKEGILANERFTSSERNDAYFRHGTLTTKLPQLQKFLENHPENENFSGICDGVTKAFKLMDKAVEAKVTNADLKKRAKAAVKIFDFDLVGAQEMLIRLYGAYFKTPTEADFTGTEEEKIASATAECQNMLIEFLDNSEEEGVDAILKEDEKLNVDEKTTVLIGKLLNADLLSFSATEGKISKKDKSGKWIEVRDMSNEYSMDEKKRLFSDFLNSDAGKDLKEDLENDLKGLDKKPKTESKKK